MNKKIFITYAVGISACMTLFSGIAFAQNRTWPPGEGPGGVQASTTPPKPPTPGFFQNIRPDIEGQNNNGEPPASTTRGIWQGGLSSTTGTFGSKVQTTLKNTRDYMKAMQFMMSARIVWIRINATIVRLEKIVTKLDSRIAKIKAAGNDTTGAEADSTDAKTSLEKAKQDMDEIKTILMSVSPTTPPDASATTTIKTDSQEAESEIKTAQSDIENATQSLQGLKANENTSIKTSPSEGTQ